MTITTRLARREPFTLYLPFTVETSEEKKASAWQKISSTPAVVTGTTRVQYSWTTEALVAS